MPTRNAVLIHSTGRESYIRRNEAERKLRAGEVSFLGHRAGVPILKEKGDAFFWNGSTQRRYFDRDRGCYVWTNPMRRPGEVVS